VLRKFFKNENLERTFSEHIEEMSKPGVEGGFMEIVAASRLYVTGIAVYKPEPKYLPIFEIKNPRATEEIAFELENVEALYE
jgi:hypothetical protein